jgi:hypothetical protein
MALYSQSELDIKAKATVLSIDRHLEHYNIIQNIGGTYNKFCARAGTKKQSSGARKITEGVRLRLLFEILCYSAFLTSRIIPKYVSKKRLIRKKTNYELARYFNNQVARYLLKLCHSHGMTKLREIVLLSPPPDAKIKFGDPLHPAARLREYSRFHTTKRGTEVQQLGMNLGKALDPYHYSTLQSLWQTQAKTLVKVAEAVMTEVFKPPVKLIR